MNDTKVTIVTPSYNQADFIEKTIVSVLSQDYPNVEYIIIDGGSTDGSLDIIKSYEKQLAYWVSEKDSGQTNAINKGFSKSSGEIFSWLNSDDMLTPSAVKIAVDYFLKFSEVGLVYGDRLHIDAKGNVIGINKAPTHDSGMFSKNITLPQEVAFFRKSAFQSVGGLDDELHFSMDFDLWCKMSKITNMRHIPAFLGYFREHSSAKSVIYHDCTDNECERFILEHRQVFRKYFDRDLPSPVRMRWYRLMRQVRLLAEQTTKIYRDELRGLIKMMASTK